jgi:hypothetical protein
MGTRRTDPRLLLAAVVAQAVIGTLTVRDINARPAELIRGPKLLWRLWGGTNAFGALVYWLVGRRPSRGTDPVAQRSPPASRVTGGLRGEV